MTFERAPGPGAEPGLPHVAEIPSAGATSPTPVQIRLQILSTEHWSLLASRGLAWNEIFSRAGMFLSTLSGSIVALGLIAGVDGFHDAFFVFALVILPVVLFVGLGTWIRMGAANYHDAQTVIGMNRIRGAYLEIAPDLARYFVMGVHDDPPGVSITMGVPPRTPTVVHLLASTPFLIIVLNAVVAGAIAAVALVAFGTPEPLAVVVIAVVVAILVAVLEVRSAAQRIRDQQLLVEPLFPTPGVQTTATRVLGTDIPDFRPSRPDADRPTSPPPPNP
jgi:hypothetical protein